MAAECAVHSSPPTPAESAAPASFLFLLHILPSETLLAFQLRLLLAKWDALCVVLHFMTCHSRKCHRPRASSCHKSIEVMLGCLGAQRAVQWSLLTKALRWNICFLFACVLVQSRGTISYDDVAAADDVAMQEIIAHIALSPMPWHLLLACIVSAFDLVCPPAIAAAFHPPARW